MENHEPDRSQDRDGLEKLIREWRSSLVPSMAFTEADMLELEDHLRSRTSSLLEEGWDLEAAFQAAVAELGQPNELIPRFREQNRRVLLQEAFILFAWGFLAFASLWVLQDFLYRVVAIAVASLSQSIPWTNTALKTTVIVSVLLLLLPFGIALRSRSYRFRRAAGESWLFLFVPLIVVPTEFFSYFVLEKIVKFGRGGWFSLYSTDYAFPGVSLGGLAKLIDLPERFPLLLDGEPIWQQTEFADLAPHFRHAQITLAALGFILALIIIWRKGWSLSSCRRCFFFAGTNLYLGLYVLGNLGYYILSRKLGQGIVMTFVFIVTPLLQLVVPALSRHGLKKNRFMASDG